MSTERETKVFDDEVREDAVLEKLGYQQELRRSFGLLGMIGFAFSIVTSWTALGGVLIVGVESGVRCSPQRLGSMKTLLIVTSRARLL